MQLAQVNQVRFNYVIQIYFVQFQLCGKSGAVGQHVPDVSKKFFKICIILRARNHQSKTNLLNLVMELGDSLKRKNFTCLLKLCYDAILGMHMRHRKNVGLRYARVKIITSFILDFLENHTK